MKYIAIKSFQKRVLYFYLEIHIFIPQFLALWSLRWKWNVNQINIIKTSTYQNMLNLAILSYFSFLVSLINYPVPYSLHSLFFKHNWCSYVGFYQIHMLKDILKKFYQVTQQCRNCENSNKIVVLLVPSYYANNLWKSLRMESQM